MLVALALSGLPARGQLSEEEKKQLFLKAREDIRPIPRASPTPRPTPRVLPSPTPRPSPTPPPTPTPRAAAKPTPAQPVGEDVIPLEGSQPPEARAETSSETPAPSPRTPRPSPSPRPSPPAATPPPAVSPTPRPSPKATPAPQRGSGPQPAAPIHIEKSGLAEDQGLEPPPPKIRRSGWFKRYRYLTPAVRRAIDQAPVRKGQWQYIIIHNSGTRQGSARIFDLYHRNVRKMQNGLAYHFVIGNGKGAGDGEIEVGRRWTRQINGGHVASDYLNRIALGICLVGDFNRDLPTRAQMEALEELVDYLRARVGKTKGRPAAVRGHKQINPRPTDCPGDRFDLRWLRRRFGW